MIQISQVSQIPLILKNIRKCNTWLSKLVKTFDQLSHNKLWCHLLTDHTCTFQMLTHYTWLPWSKTRSSCSSRRKSKSVESALNVLVTLWLLWPLCHWSVISSSSCLEVPLRSSVQFLLKLIEVQSRWPLIQQPSTGSLSLNCCLVSSFSFRQEVLLKFLLQFSKNTELLR